MTSPKKIKRSVLNTSNKYQEQIILLTFFPAVLMYLSFVCAAFLGHPVVVKALLKGPASQTQEILGNYSTALVAWMGLVLTVSLISAYIISRNMLGAFGRIIRELDEIIAGRSK